MKVTTRYPARETFSILLKGITPFHRNMREVTHAYEPTGLSTPGAVHEDIDFAPQKQVT